MNLAAAARAYEPEPESDIIEWTSPGKSVTVAIDHGRNILRIFSEPDPSPVDWAKACEIIRYLGIPDIGEPTRDRDLETWCVRFELERLIEPLTIRSGALIFFAQWHVTMRIL